MTPFALIVAHDEKCGIGKNNDLPWHLPSDLKYFKSVTTTTKDPNKQNIVIMGRKTWDSIPEKYRPMAGRINIVLTRQSNLNFPNGVMVENTLENGLKTAGQLVEAGQAESIFIIGGATLYTEAITHPNCDTLYITKLQNTFDCDAFFPEYAAFSTCQSASETHTDNGISFTFNIYKK